MGLLHCCLLPPASLSPVSGVCRLPSSCPPGSPSLPRCSALTAAPPLHSWQAQRRLGRERRVGSQPSLESTPGEKRGEGAARGCSLQAGVRVLQVIGVQGNCCPRAGCWPPPFLPGDRAAARSHPLLPLPCHPGAPSQIPSPFKCAQPSPLESGPHPHLLVSQVLQRPSPLVPACPEPGLHPALRHVPPIFITTWPAGPGPAHRAASFMVPSAVTCDFPHLPDTKDDVLTGGHVLRSTCQALGRRANASLFSLQAGQGMVAGKNGVLSEPLSG